MVGIVTLADEVLPDDLFPRQKIIVSPDVAAKYDCLPGTPPPGSTFAENVAALIPAECALAYRYYSLSLSNGAVDVKPALESFVRTSSAMNVDLADVSDLEETGAEPPGYFLVATETELEARRVERSIRPTVTALAVFAVAAAAVTIGIAGLAVAREVRRAQPDQRQWYQLGVGSATRAVVVGTPPAAAAAAGLIIAIVVAGCCTPARSGSSMPSPRTS